MGYPEIGAIFHQLVDSPRSGLYYGTKIVSTSCREGFMQGGLYLVSSDMISCILRAIDEPPGVDGMNRTFDWQMRYAIAEDGLFGCSVWRAQRDGFCKSLVSW